MTDQDLTERLEGMDRRTVLQALTAAGFVGVIGGASQPAMAATTEPRIALGDDYVIDADPDGNGDLVVEHQPSGARFRYDQSAGSWTFDDPVALGDALDAGGNDVTNVGTADANSVETDTATVTTSLTDGAGVSHTGELADDGDAQPPETHDNTAHSLAFVSDGDGTTRQIWVIASGASDPAGAGTNDIIFEEQS